jgi:hypothetical protein
MRQKIKELRERRKAKKELKAEAGDRLPRITNETVATHREEVLSGARKYIYPLQHSKHKVVYITTSLFIAAVVGFTTYCVVSLYRLQSTSTFIYRVTQVIPFPIARSGNHFIAYENYLFELRHYMHYYETEQKLSFSSESGRQQLNSYKQRAFEKIEADARIKQIAKEKGISVSDAEVDDQIELSRKQNRLGGSSQVFEDVIREYYGWSLNDFRRSLRTQLLEQKVDAALDTAARARADEAVRAVRNGMPFADAVKTYSDDATTKQNGGEIGFIDRSNTAATPQTIDTLFKLKAGEVSDPIVVNYESGFAFEILQNIDGGATRAKTAHIIIKITPMATYLNDLREKQPTRRYIKLP